MIGHVIVKKDIVLTPDWVARDMVEHFKPTGRVLDPCRGEGAFYKYLAPDAEWCEVREGRNFFNWNEHVDWVIGNPPYSIFSRWLRHSLDVADNICYLIPCNKVFNSFTAIKSVLAWGGVNEMRAYGRGSSIGFPIGFAAGAVLFIKNYHGPMKLNIYEGDKP